MSSTGEGKELRVVAKELKIGTESLPRVEDISCVERFETSISVFCLSYRGVDIMFFREDIG